MASTRSILSAAKAAAPAGRPTPVPQGSGPSMLAQLDVQSGYANAYGNFLPRPAATYTQGAFGPFSPVVPTPVDTPGESGRAEPRPTQFQVGWNLPVGEPGTEGIKLATFGTLRTLADLYSVARACIQLRKSEVRGLEWDIMPTADAAKANKGSEKWFRDFGERRAQAMKWFRRPDPDFFSWNTWIDAVLEEVFVFDALSLHIRPKRGKRAGMKKGLLGSDLDSLELISGPTIRPLYDIRGGYPRPPAPAYQQYLYGVPRSDLMQMVTGHDIEQSGLADSLWGQYRADQLLYLPMVPRRWTPYGLPPVERALIPIMSGLQKQGWALDWFREGTVPAIYMSPGDESMTPNQMRELQDALNAFAGDPAWHHKIIVLPPNSKVMPQRDTQLADQFDEVIMNQVCMAFDVMPMELGIAPKVSTTMSPGAANQMAKMSQSATERKATKPLLMFLADIMNTILQIVCGQDDMEFVFEGLEEEQDQEALTNMLVLQVTNGFRSVDEARDELNLQPWGLPETSGPVFLAQTGPVAFDLSIQQQAASAQQATQAPPAVAASKPGQPAPDDEQQPAPAGAAGGSGADTSTTQQNTQANAAKPQPKPGTTVQDTPGHAAAEGHDTESGKPSTSPGATAKPANTNGAGKVTVSVGIAKAMNAELESLARHLRKGRLISTWTPKHIPSSTLARISEHLAKGVDADNAVKLATVTTLDFGDVAPKARNGSTWPGSTHADQLTLLYRDRIHTALQRAVDTATRDSRGVRADTLTKGITERLTPILRSLWRESWYLGSRSAAALVGMAKAASVDWGTWTPGDSATADLGDALDAFQERMWLADKGVSDIAETGIDKAIAAAQAAMVANLPIRDLTQQLYGVLASLSRADVIARNEIMTFVNAGAVNTYMAAGVSFIEWVTSGVDNCQWCTINENDGPTKIGDAFSSGLQWPPQHPDCQCEIVPAGTNKATRRVIPLSGETVWVDVDTPEANPAGGGGQSPVRHWGDGTQSGPDVPVTGGVPGSTPGGEPPRWDGTLPNGYQGGYYGGGSDATYLGGNGHQVDTAAYSGDGYPTNGEPWPQRGHGTEQPTGIVVPGAENDRGRAPNAAGKQYATQCIAAGIAVQAGDTGRVLMLQRAPNPTQCTCGMPVEWDVSGGWQHADGSISHDDDQTSVSDRVGTHPPDSAAGRWEFPGGCREDEDDATAARREWQEETGYVLPMGQWVDGWTSDNGVYHGFILRIDHESDVPVNGTRDQVSNPDDPDGDAVETLAWVDPANPPDLRAELAVDWDHVVEALSTNKDASWPKATADEVRTVMRHNFPDSALTWLEDAQWRGPARVPAGMVNYSGERTWAAHHQVPSVEHFEQRVRAGDEPRPVILIDTPDKHDARYVIVDGHHRAIAERNVRGWLWAYVGRVTSKTGPWDETHLYQHHQGNDPNNG